jgi:CubicO group peptidase (beta-lactamase class C family)
VVSNLRVSAIVIAGGFSAAASLAQGNDTTAAIDAYLRPYVQTQNFSGVVLVEKRGRVIFEEPYGFANRQKRLHNTRQTRFHIASMSMQFTAAAILRLVDQGSITLDEHASDFVRAVEGADKITIRDLLTERSGLPDINGLPNYDDGILQRHQTPASLVKVIEGKPLLFDPGSRFLHEEHSAYNLLALIVERKTGLPFAAALETLVFRPSALMASAADDDSVTDATYMAKGYEAAGAYDLKPAKAIHWSAKAGNASVYTTAADEARWVDTLFNGHALSAASRDAVLDTSLGVGYGWFKSELKRFGQTAYYMNGRSPGFSSFVLYLPEAKTTVVLLGNIYSSATTPMGYDIAALALGLPYEKLQLMKEAPTAAELKTCSGIFQFGPDFYQANAKVMLIAKDRELFLSWPSGSITALLPVQRDHFIDRSYWQDIRIERDDDGKPIALVYDRFRGVAISSP